MDGEKRLTEYGKFHMGEGSLPKSPVYRLAFVENRPSNASNFVILPVFCDFGHVQSVIELLGKQVNNALNVY